MNWWKNLWSLDNSRLNTGAVFAAAAAVLAMAVVVFNEFVMGMDTGTNNRYLLLGLIGLGGWGFHAALRNPMPPPEAKKKEGGDDGDD